MSKKRASFGSVVVSVMLSETRGAFRCHELPDWQRPMWLLWALLPGLVAGVGEVGRPLVGLWRIAIGDFTAGLQFFLQPFVFFFQPFVVVGIATG